MLDSFHQLADGICIVVPELAFTKPIKPWPKPGVGLHGSASQRQSRFYSESGAKNHELTNQLGNVLTIITEKKLPVCSSNNIFYFIEDLVSATDYSPFGAPLAEITWQGECRLPMFSLLNIVFVNVMHVIHFLKACISPKYQTLHEAFSEDYIGFTKNLHLSIKIDYH